MPLEGKTIIVTGAASGIGAGVAKLAMSQGAQVLAVDRNEPDYTAAAFIRTDLSDPHSIAEAARQIPEGANALCNIAGLPPTAGREAVLRVNFLGLREFTETLVPKLADDSAIVNLASLAGSGWADARGDISDFLAVRDFSKVREFCDARGIDDSRSYFFSKECLIVWTMRNRWTWRPRGIRMNCVSPGPVETPILPDFLATLGERAAQDMEIMDRPGRVDDIAPVVTFLCSDAGAWIRGADIPVDGGMRSHILCGASGLD